jgi:hypothetical protein
MTDQVAVLESIRDVLSGKGPGKSEPTKEAMSSAEDEEILDLTKMLNDDGSITDLNTDFAATETANTDKQDNTEIEDDNMANTSATKGDDVLDEIDKLLSNDGAESQEVEKSEAISPDDLDAMFDSPAFEAPPAKEEIKKEKVESITDDSIELELAEETKKNEEPMTEETTEIAEENLISDAAADKAKSAISDLLKVTGKNEKSAKEASQSPTFRNGDTVEDLVMESLKPMLAKWLDENLSSLVEEIVQKEISRIIPK